MISWPELGTRVTVRYRRPPGTDPPLTDVIGHLLQIAPTIRVRTKTGDEVTVDPDDVVALRALTDQPVRASQIRALEHADALSWPGIEQRWVDGWLLRAGRGIAIESNSAVALDASASQAVIPEIVDWYSRRGLTPRLAVADRLIRLPTRDGTAHRVLVRDVRATETEPTVHLSTRPDGVYPDPVDEMTCVDGELIFGIAGDGAARATVTGAPDGTRWVGLSAIRSADSELGEALLGWGASRGATRAYIRVRDDDLATADLARSLGFVLHHHSHYIVAGPLT